MDIGNVYSYKVVRVDVGAEMLRRIIIYFTVLLFIVSTALVVLFILFERYMQLLICVGMYIMGVLILILSGRGVHYYIYRFSETDLEIESDRGEKCTIPFTSCKDLRKVEQSDGERSDMQRYCFAVNKVTAKTIVKDGRFNEYVFSQEGNALLLLLDDYALTIIQRSK